METVMEEHRALDVIFSDATYPADAVYMVRQTLLDWDLDGLTEAVCLHANCGLKVVKQLAGDWGTIPLTDEKCVFAEFWITK